MLFLSLYTSATPPSGPPSAEHMAAMMKLIEDMSGSGVLVTTGGILSRETGMKVTRKTFSPAKGKDGAEVVLFVIENGGHTWPGRPSRARFLGPSTTDVSANDLMWEFFEKHPMPDPAGPKTAATQPAKPS